MSGYERVYRGRSGQLAVMVELLWRGWNVALPEVDMGDDIFVVRDRMEHFSRVQVKTAAATLYKRKIGYRARFNVSVAQLVERQIPELIFVFAVRREDAWSDFLVINQTALRLAHDEHTIASSFTKRGKEHLQFTFSFSESAVTARSHDVTSWRSQWALCDPSYRGF